MPKIHYFSNKYRQELEAHRPQRPLIFNIGDLKLGDLTKFWLLGLWRNQLQKNHMASFLWRCYHYVSQMTSPK